MSGAEKFDANRRLGELALWADDAAIWIERATAAGLADQPRGALVTVQFHRSELKAFVTGMRMSARSLLGIVQPVPPPVSPPAAEATGPVALPGGCVLHHLPDRRGAAPCVERGAP